MAGATFKKRNRNLFKRVYPYVRRAPVFDYISDRETVIETAKITFTNSSSESYTFTSTFSNIPIVTVVSVDSESNDTANVNVFISSLSNSSVTIETSQNFTGAVHLHAILIGAS
tara:strand:+ start:6842 stop:7183 length:342 start_codon:yes stop_codon:yes gene_type:complete